MLATGGKRCSDFLLHLRLRELGLRLGSRAEGGLNAEPSRANREGDPGLYWLQVIRHLSKKGVY